MNRLSLIVSVFVTATAMFIANTANAAASPSPSALTAYSQGQAYERLFQDHVMPGTCGVVLERPRCNSDFRAIQALRGGDPTDSAMEAWLATGNLSLAVKEWNGMYVPDQAWTETPEFAWWFTAGQVSIATSLPDSSATADYIGHYADLLAAHNEAAPAEFRGMVSSTGPPVTRLQPLQAALLKAVPVEAYPEPAGAEGTKGDAQLGIYLSTLQELVDNPLALSRPESRAFGLVVARRLQAINDTYAAGSSLSSVTAALSGTIPSDHMQVEALLRQPLSNAVSTKWPLARRQACVFGSIVAQVAYNAAVLRDSQADATFRAVIARVPPYAGMSSRVATDLAALLNIPNAGKGGDWAAINAAASRTVTDIVATP
jgi:hypothetical protein